MTDDESGGAKSDADLIAIIGMAGRFPGAHDVGEYWQNLQAGVESIRSLSDEELIAAGVPRRDLNDPNYVKVCPVLEGIDLFDAGFFGLSPREASVMDPAHRLFLQCVWEAVEDSGNRCLPQDGPVAVFASSGAPLYWANNLKTNPELMHSMGDFLVRHTGNDMNFLSTRASYEFDFRGPSVNVQTACSSGLVSVHMAKESLRKGECDVAIAGAATVLVPMAQGYHYKEGEILSPDGHCRPFDRDSAGTVFGSGVGCVVLKRLVDAQDSGDTIHAVIRGSAMNNDGSVKVGFLAPGVEGQAEVIRRALADARIEPRDLGYVEAHGTGTVVGDPIELTALALVFSEGEGAPNPCAVGSVKSNIGHLGEAAAMASLIKAALCLKNRKIPATLGFQHLNPEIDFESSPFFVNDQLSEWDGEDPLRCGVTALGAGGTNCHVVLEEAPQPLQGEEGRAEKLLLLSAKSSASLNAMRFKLADFLEANPQLDLSDVAYTLAVGRRGFSHRHAVVAPTSGEAAQVLREPIRNRASGSTADDTNISIVFSFPGGGAQHAGMGRGLYEAEPVYREVIDECVSICQTELGENLLSVLYPESISEVEGSDKRALRRPSLGLPALLATEMALATLYESWGVIPEALLGHSIGQCVAACFAGVMTLEEAMRLVILRGQLFERVEEGRMLSVSLPEAQLRSIMPEGLDIASVNAPELCVASGPSHLVDKLQSKLTELGHEWAPIHLDVAAHSVMLEPVLDEFRALVATLDLQPPTIPIASNLTGSWLTDEEATDPHYWTAHLRNTVRFSDCVGTLVHDRARIFLELGPGRALTSLVMAHGEYSVRAVNSMRSYGEDCGDLQYALLALGRLWTEGAALEEDALYVEELRYRVPLPAYAFDEQSYWVEPGAGTAILETNRGDLRRIEDLDDWFSSLSWVPSPISNAKPNSSQTWVLFSEDAAFVDALRAADNELQIITVSTGSHFEQISSNGWMLDPKDPRQFVMLFEHLAQMGITPDHIVYMWNINSRFGFSWLESLRWDGRKDEAYQRQLTLCFSAAVSLARAVATCLEQVQLSYVSHGAILTGQENLTPMQALMIGPAFVLPREMPEVNCRLIDLAGTIGGGVLIARQYEQLVRELMAETTERIVSLRRHVRLVSRLSRMELPKANDGAGWAETKGAILITGGLGGIGLEVALHLAKAGPVKLALLSRGGLADRAQWPSILSGRSAGSEAQKGRIRAVSELLRLGAEVYVVRADVSNEESLSSGLERAQERLGPIKGVIHLAGLLDDGPILSKTPESMLRVLAPKVQGAMLLDELLGDALDFFVAFSSVSSFLGLPGQVDYTAANAFLDAFVQDRRMRRPGRSVVVNWNAWRDVGMIMRAQSETSLAPHPKQLCFHPALDGYERDSADQRWYATEFSVEGHWMLSEHQIRNAAAVIPGTGFLELARAAFCDSVREGPVEISNVAFTSPFQVAPGQARQLTIRLRVSGDTNAVVMSSELDSDPHMTGQVRALRGTAPTRVDLNAVRMRCPSFRPSEDGFLDQHLVSFGPRWGNIVGTHEGDAESLVELKLPAAFKDDLDDFRLHPALMDMATGGSQFLIPDFDPKEDLFVPVGYDRVRMYSGLPRHIFSHVRCLPETNHQFAFFDVTVTDETGRVLVDIRRFTMTRLPEDAAILSAQKQPHQQSYAAKENALAALLEHAIAPEEGLLQLDRLMTQSEVTQIVASSVDLTHWLEVLGAEARRARGEDDLDDSVVFSRPELGINFVEPEGPVEILLAKLWSKLLGVDGVGSCDDFFELGGNSLTAVRLFTQVRKEFGVAFGISTLFEAPTIKGLAEILKEEGVDDALPAEGERTEKTDRWSPIVPLSRGGSKPPLFCVAGQGGNPMHLLGLARLIDSDRPFYGLQHRGMDEGSEPYGSVEEMAIDFLDHMQRIQPQGPYIIGGYSGGGTVAVELARLLLSRGESVEKVILIDCFTPGVRGPSGAHEILRSLEYGIKSQGIFYLVRKVRDVVQSLVKRLGSRTSFEAGRAPVSMYERASTNWQALDSRYTVEQVNVSGILLRAEPSNSEAAAHLDARYEGWPEILTGGVEVVRTPGAHTTIYNEPNVQVLAAHIRDALK